MTYKGETREKGVNRQVIVVMVVPHGDGGLSPLCRRHKAAAAVGFWAKMQHVATACGELQPAAAGCCHGERKGTGSCCGVGSKEAAAGWGRRRRR